MDKVSEDGNEAGTELHQQAGQSSHSHGGGDFCSPFCVCNCCHIVTFFTRPASPEFYRMADLKIFSGKYNSIPMLSVNSIWRPPKPVTGKGILI